MKKIGDLLQFHIGMLYQKTGLKVIREKCKAKYMHFGAFDIQKRENADFVLSDLRCTKPSRD